ncbi:MAG: glycosyltransferase family A protein [Pirellulales bacterium]
MKHLRIATVIPLYNGRNYIEQAIESVLGQTRQSDRVVVVDDGSSDDGAELVVRAFEQHGVELIRTDNGGQSRARNIGVRAASTCDLVAFLDQDDVWYPEHLEVLEGVFLTPGARRLAYVYSNLDQIDLAGRRIHQSILDLISGPRQKTKLHELIGFDLFVLPSASLVDRSAFLSVEGFDERLSGYEDDDLFVRLFIAGFNHAYVATPLSQWRIFGESCSQSPRMRKSRLHYAMKLIGMFPRDETAGLDYPRNVIWPRFARTLLLEMKRARRTNNRTACDALADDFVQIAKAVNGYGPTARLRLAKHRVKSMLRAA